MKLFSALIASTVCFSVHAWGASCPSPTFTPSREVKIRGDKLLIVTHPSTRWDGRYSSKMGMDATVQFAKAKNIPVIYLQDSDTARTNQTYFFSDCRPDYWVASEGGEFDFDIPSHIYSVGGHWEMCQATTMSGVMSKWKYAKGNADLRITQVMDGIYTAGERFSNADPFYNDFKRFMDIISFGNPRDTWFIRKLSLLESMGIVKDPAMQVAFLKRNLPPLKDLSPSYEVNLVINGKQVETLRPSDGRGEKHTLTLEFVNTLYSGGYIPAFR